MKDNYLQSRNKTVVKANELIQRSRFNLSLLQQKIVLYLISQISPFDEDFELYEFSIPEFCRVCGLDEANGGNYIALKNAIKEIADKSIWVNLEDGRNTLVRWIEKPYINNKSGVIQIRLDQDMKPFLLQLKENFTKYELIFTLHFKSKYSIRLYELIKSIHYFELKPYTREYTIEELKGLLGAETYTTYQAFKARALEPAVQEINRYSDKWLEYEPIRQGRSFVKVRLTVGSKNSIEVLKIRDEIEKELGSNQLSLWGEM